MPPPHASPAPPGVLPAQFVELGLLSQAKCLIANRGGFSDTARWLGGNTECVRFVGEAPWGKQPGKECFAELAESLGTTTSWT